MVSAACLVCHAALEHESVNMLCLEPSSSSLHCTAGPGFRNNSGLLRADVTPVLSIG